MLTITADQTVTKIKQFITILRMGMKSKLGFTTGDGEDTMITIMAIHHTMRAIPVTLARKLCKQLSTLHQEK